MESKIVYIEEEFIVEVTKEVEIISGYINSVELEGQDKDLFYKAYYYLIDFYTEKLKECKPELRESENLIFEGFYQGQEDGFVDVANFEKL